MYENVYGKTRSRFGENAVALPMDVDRPCFKTKSARRNNFERVNFSDIFPFIFRFCLLCVVSLNKGNSSIAY